MRSMHSSMHRSRTCGSQARTSSKAGMHAGVSTAFTATSSTRGALVTCMAHPRRVAKVTSQIQREISEMFIYDQVVQEAICPERRTGDDKLSAVASLTDVYVSNDLQVVKAYVSVYSDEQGKERAINNLKRIAPYVRGKIGQALKLRLTPEIRFLHDNTLDEYEKIQEAIGREDFDRYIAEAAAEAQGQPSSSSSGALGQDHGSDNDDDEDAGFFDLPAEGDAAAVAAAAAGPSSKQQDGQQVPQKVSWSRHDPATFFAVDEDEDPDENPSEAWYGRAGPFDDLFGGSGQGLYAEKPQQREQQQQQQQRGRTARGNGGKKRQQQPKAAQQ